MRISRVERAHVYSPLRYPGGKAGLLGFFREVIRRNELTDVTYVEPFAGGAGAALGLLISEQVSNIVINDFDPAVAAFWRAATAQNAEFRNRVLDAELNVEEWRRQKAIYKNPGDASDLDLGFAMFYLNRTNRSGVLHAGPIGGVDQSGNYKIDARFNRETLLEKLRLIGLYRDRIEVTERDGLEVVNEWAGRASALIYVDPPYIAKGSSLYLNAFENGDHKRLASCLNRRAQRNWVLTYDHHPLVDQLYSKRRRVPFNLHYSVHSARNATETMVFADGLVAPLTESDW